MCERHTACRCSTPLLLSLSLTLDAAAGTVLLRGDLVWCCCHRGAVSLGFSDKMGQGEGVDARH